MSPALTAAAAGGAAAGVMYLMALTGSVGGLILVYLAPLPLFMVGLAYGGRAAIVAAGLATVVVAGMAGSPVMAMAFLLLAGLPVVTLVRQALLVRQLPDGATEWYPAGGLLVALTGLAAAAVVTADVVALAFAGGDGLHGVVRDMLTGPLGGLFPDAGAPPSTTDAANPAATAAGLIAAMFPGVVAISWLLMVIINGLLAQAVLVRFNRQLRPSLTMAGLHLPGWLPLVLALVMLASLVLDDHVGFVAFNLSIVAIVPFVFSGLAVVHAVAATRASRLVILVLFYLFLSLFVWPVILVIGLGLIEQWVGLRRRLAAASAGRGET